MLPPTWMLFVAPLLGAATAILYARYGDRGEMPILGLIILAFVLSCLYGILLYVIWLKITTPG